MIDIHAPEESRGSPEESGESEPLVFFFLRHGQSLANVQGVRAGGDYDVPLTSVGIRQAAAAAETLARTADHRIGLIISSPLRRVRATTEEVNKVLNVPVLFEPSLAERYLGFWNNQPVDRTEQPMRAGVAPPGGESEEEFTARIRNAVCLVLGHLHRRPLVVASRGVARVMTRLLTGVEGVALDNCDLVRVGLCSLVPSEDRLGVASLASLEG
ncbi:MAG: histidine phosphatase family protein [Alphaproteobacteria bacterium]